VAQFLGIFDREQAQFFGVRHVGLLAVAQALGQALRQDTQQRIGKVERIHAHVHQTGDGLGRRVGVQRGEHQVAGQRGLDAHGHGFLVARLAHHDDVRVGAQEGAHDQREVDAGLLVDLDLAQTLSG
jgi:hypothetical protein